MSTTKPTLHYLTLSPIPLESLPTPSTSTSPSSYSTFTSSLLAESSALLSHPLWASQSTKSWHNDLVLTCTLPHDAVNLEPAFPLAAPAPAAPVKRSFFGGGGGGSGAAPDKSGKEEGIAWHRRTSTITGQNWPEWWDALAVKHAEKEVDYVHTLEKVVSVGAEEQECVMKLYSLPFPTTNRSFLVSVVVLDTTPSATNSTPAPLRSFQVFTLPIEDPTPSTSHVDKGYVRGRYVAVECVQEVKRDETTGQSDIEWSCASMSTAGGSIPIRLAESHMGSSMSSHVPPFLAWLAKRSQTATPASSEQHSHHLLRRVSSRSKKQHESEAGAAQVAAA